MEYIPSPTRLTERPRDPNPIAALGAIALVERPPYPAALAGPVVVPVTTREADTLSRQMHFITISPPKHAGINGAGTILKRSPERPVTADALSPVTLANLDSVYTYYRPRLERYAYHRVGNFQDAQDYVATTFEKAIRSLNQRGAIKYTSQWLYRILNNTITDSHDRQLHRQMASLDRAVSPGVKESLADTIPSPDDDYSMAERVDQRSVLSHVFKNLLPLDAQVLRLYEYEGYTCKEIGTAINKSEAYVKTRLDRARGRAYKLAQQFLNNAPLPARRYRRQP